MPTVPISFEATLFRNKFISRENPCAPPKSARNFTTRPYSPLVLLFFTSLSLYIRQNENSAVHTTFPFLQTARFSFTFAKIAKKMFKSCFRTYIIGDNMGIGIKIPIQRVLFFVFSTIDVKYSSKLGVISLIYLYL